ncbi:hypothetical protein [Spirosoma sp. KCTC 42546]|nr:hypothetical protein [Spirosoma sp. KCTC 42546]
MNQGHIGFDHRYILNQTGCKVSRFKSCSRRGTAPITLLDREG